MTIKVLVIAGIAAVVMGLTIGFLWVQVGLPSDRDQSPWDASIVIFPTLYALWVPLIYLFFSAVWFVLSQQPFNPQERLFFTLEQYSYVGVLFFLLLQVVWERLGNPGLWFKFAILILILVKSFLVFRMLYRSFLRVQPVLLVVLGVGVHLLLFFFTYQSLSFSITDLVQHANLAQLGIILIKSLCLNLMTLEMFRLGVGMAKSVQSAFFSWVAVTLTFPIIGFPKISFILMGLLLIFILRMIFTRLNTRELMIGLLEPVNSMLLLKLFIFLAILAAAGIVFWSNVKPGFEVRSGRAVQTAISTLFDGQFGVFCYTPIYWLAVFGIVYLIFFKVWDGILLFITGALLYFGYHLAVYGMLGRRIEQSDSVPFLPILGVFIAIAHDRFGKTWLFRLSVRVVVVVTVGITALLLLLHPDFISIPSKIAEITRRVTLILGGDLSYIAPSMIFQPVPLSLFIWIGIVVLTAVVCCYIHTRAAALFLKHVKKRLPRSVRFREFTFAPYIVALLFLLGGLAIHYRASSLPIPLTEPIHLSKFQRQKEITLNDGPRSTGIVIVSTLTGSLTVPHKTPVANVVIIDQDQHFETFTIKAGKDTSEETFEQQGLKYKITHGRAAIYRSWIANAENGTSFLAHEYYTTLFFSKPLNVQKLTLKFIDRQPQEPFSNVVLHIKGLHLLQ